METHHIDHIARTAAAMINSNQVILNGLSSLMRTVREPSNALAARLDRADRIELLIYENHDPEGCVDLLNETMGEHSAFHHKFGYYLWVQASWNALLPTGWTNRIEYLNLPLARSTHLLAVSPCDIMLANIATRPDTILNMDLLIGGVVTPEKLLHIAQEWQLPEDKKRLVRERVLSIQSTLNEVNKINSNAPTTINNVISIFGKGSKRQKQEKKISEAD